MESLEHCLSLFMLRHLAGLHDNQVEYSIQQLSTMADADQVVPQAEIIVLQLRLHYFGVCLLFLRMNKVRWLHMASNEREGNPS